MKKLLILLTACLLGACASSSSKPLVGADRDAHGCIGSAGYVWSQTQGKCVRPWEQPQDKQPALRAN